MTDQKFYIETGDPPAKQRILEEALRLFATRGLASTSIRDIASASGYTNPALYKHFKTKEALASALFERCYREQLARVNTALQGHEGFADRFHAFLVAFARMFDDHPHAVIFTSDALATLWPKMPEDLRSRTMITVTRELLQLGRRERLVAKDADLSLQINLVVGMLSQLTRQLYLGAAKGPASSLVKETERILRAGLT